MSKISNFFKVINDYGTDKENVSDENSPTKINSTFGDDIIGNPSEGLEIEHSQNQIESNIKYNNQDYKLIENGDFKGDVVKLKNGNEIITHYKYEDCKPEDLVKDKTSGKPIAKKTEVAFLAMQEAAKKEGIKLRIVSGYRSSDYQKTVFKKKFTDKQRFSVTQVIKRAKWSAPSGYSEHHTGLAMDINSLESSFGNTKEYKWLKENAAKYGFEQSFPKGNKQNVAVEPWHWRFVGDEESKEIFKQARNAENE